MSCIYTTENSHCRWNLSLPGTTYTIKWRTKSIIICSLIVTSLHVHVHAVGREIEAKFPIWLFHYHPNDSQVWGQCLFSPVVGCRQHQPSRVSFESKQQSASHLEKQCVYTVYLFTCTHSEESLVYIVHVNLLFCTLSNSACTCMYIVPLQSPHGQSAWGGCSLAGHQWLSHTWWTPRQPIEHSRHHPEWLETEATVNTVTYIGVLVHTVFSLKYRTL